MLRKRITLIWVQGKPCLSREGLGTSEEHIKGEPFFEVSLGGGEEVFDVGLGGGAKWFLTEQLRLYGKCREEVSEVVNLYFWPS